MRRIVIALVLVCAIPAFAQETAPDLEPVVYDIPEFERIMPNNGIIYRRDYKQVIGIVEVRDAPNGNIIRTRPAGTYFVAVNSYQDGWAQINVNEWIPANQLLAAPVSYLGGVFLDGTTHIGILHEATRIRPVPELDFDETMPLLQQYTAISIIAIDGEWVQIGDMAWIPRDRVGIVNPIARPNGVTSARWVGVDVTEQTIIAYDGATPIFASLVSTGLRVSPTDLGIHDIYVRFHQRDMSRGDTTQPYFYWMEDVPYTFYFNGNQALHGAYWHDSFGTRQSHGCVNMSLTDAYWLYSWLSEATDFSATSDVLPQVYVYEA